MWFSLLHAQSWDLVTPPNTPGGWVVDSDLATATDAFLSSPNSLKLVPGPFPAAARWDTQDGNAGNVRVKSAFRFDVAGGTPKQTWTLRARGDVGFLNGYAVDVEPTGSANDGVQLYKVVAGITTNLGARVGTGQIAAQAWYIFELICQGTALSVFCQRVSDNKWLSSAGTWGTTRVALISQTDGDITGQGYAGLAAFAGSSAAQWADDFELDALVPEQLKRPRKRSALSPPGRRPRRQPKTALFVSVSPVFAQPVLAAGRLRPRPGRRVRVSFWRRAPTKRAAPGLQAAPALVAGPPSTFSAADFTDFVFVRPRKRQRRVPDYARRLSKKVPRAARTVVAIGVFLAIPLPAVFARATLARKPRHERRPSAVFRRYNKPKRFGALLPIPVPPALPVSIWRKPKHERRPLPFKRFAKPKRYQRLLTLPAPAVFQPTVWRRPRHERRPYPIFRRQGKARRLQAFLTIPVQASFPGARRLPKHERRPLPFRRQGKARRLQAILALPVQGPFPGMRRPQKHERRPYPAFRRQGKARRLQAFLTIPPGQPFPWTRRRRRLVARVLRRRRPAPAQILPMPIGVLLEFGIDFVVGLPKRRGRYAIRYRRRRPASVAWIPALPLWAVGMVRRPRRKAVAVARAVRRKRAPATSWLAPVPVFPVVVLRRLRRKITAPRKLRRRPSATAWLAPVPLFSAALLRGRKRKVNLTKLRRRRKDNSPLILAPTLWLVALRAKRRRPVAPARRRRRLNLGALLSLVPLFSAALWRRPKRRLGTAARRPGRSRRLASPSWMALTFLWTVALLARKRRRAAAPRKPRRRLPATWANVLLALPLLALFLRRLKFAQRRLPLRVAKVRKVRPERPALPLFAPSPPLPVALHRRRRRRWPWIWLFRWPLRPGRRRPSQPQTIPAPPPPPPPPPPAAPVARPEGEWQAASTSVEWIAAATLLEWRAEFNTLEWKMGTPATRICFINENQKFDFDFGPRAQIALGGQTVASVTSLVADAGLSASNITISGNKVFVWLTTPTAGTYNVTCTVLTSGGETLIEKGVLRVS